MTPVITWKWSKVHAAVDSIMISAKESDRHKCLLKMISDTKKTRKIYRKDYLQVSFCNRWRPVEKIPTNQNSDLCSPGPMVTFIKYPKISEHKPQGIHQERGWKILRNGIREFVMILSPRNVRSYTHIVSLTGLP